MKNKRFQQLVEDHYDRLFRAALFMCGDELAAEDLIQETLLAAAQSLHRFEERSSLYTWLYGIMLNKCRGWLRHKHRSPVSLQQISDPDSGLSTDQLLPSGQPGPPEQAARREHEVLVRELLDELPDHHRAALTFRFVEDLSYEEIAEAMDCSIGTVKSRIHYGLKRLGRKFTQRTQPQDQGPP